MAIKGLMQVRARGREDPGASPRVPKLPRPAIVLAALVFLVFGWGPNLMLAAGSIVVLLMISALLWRPGEMPVLLCVFVYQWLEASILIFHANWLGLPIEEMTRSGTDLTLATVLSLAGLLAVSVGIRAAVGPSRPEIGELIWLQGRQAPQRTFLGFYVAAALISLLANVVAGLVPGLSQPLLALAHLKWAAYVIFTFATFVRPDANRTIWLVIFLLEFLLGIGGYFSSFKYVLLYSLVGIATARVRLSARQKLAAGVLAAVTLLLGVIWSAIKVEYRNFVSGGQQAQVVLVDYAQRLDKLAELMSQLDAQAMGQGATSLLERISFVEFFGAATHYVPESLPHTDGELWLDAAARPFMPRLFFPDKTFIDESELTRTYTGLRVAGMEEGTQISIGYLGESYIDFGRLGMMVFLLAWGLFIGFTYRWLLLGKYSRGLLGLGEAAAILFTTASVGTSSAKLVGAIVVSLLVMWLFNRFIARRWLPWLTRQPAPS